ncbi:dipeptidase 1-like [Schistocerca americana]|uniref:dipeptidase 1-like n=1 Tax=Schistocerca americana TaxID=7009 RepID=UPI001F4F871A|nr:dipeptidase 1-like [Schistocerca americana]XP_049940623.1 dipeptidase 1-like [Schistocerca serialis cubense]
MCKASKPCVMAATVVGLLVIILVIALPIALQDDYSAYESLAGRPVPPEVAALLKSSPLIDGHNDLPHNLRLLTHNQLSAVDFRRNLRTDAVWNCSTCFTDIPRLRAGFVGAQFWVAYVDCKSQYEDAVEKTLEQIDVIKRFIKQYPKDLQFVKTANGIEESFRKGQIASLLCVEGGHSIDSRLAVLRLYYELGVRYMTLTHSCSTPWATASPEDKEVLTVKGLTDFGKVVVQEMNRLGMMVDLSHVSHQTMLDALNVTKAPVIFSHSSAWAICNHHRNVHDDVLKLVAQNGGVVMINFYTEFVQCNKTEPATIDTVVDHINHIRRVAGVDHVGIGADYDGVDDVPLGLEDVASYPFIFERLMNPKPGEPTWNNTDLQKLAGRNLLRVLHKVEMVRDEMAKKGVKPYENLIPPSDLGNNTNCRSDG